MALKRVFRKKEGMVWFRSGHIYTFKYKNYENDPTPVILCLYQVKGYHPNTGNYHNYIQAINFTYVPRIYRRKFLRYWLLFLEKNHGNIRLTWEVVKRQFPYLRLAIRRYILDKRLLMDLKEIPINDIEDVVLPTWSRDYSKQAYMKLLSKYKKAQKYFRSTIGQSLFGKPKTTINEYKGTFKKGFGGEI